MGAVYFYHVTRNPLETTLHLLLEKSLGAGWRVLVRGCDNARLDWLDQKLWLTPEEGFLPHGLTSEPHAADQPILLGTDSEAANNAACLICIDGADTDADEIARMERVCILFDGNDDMAVQKARLQWKSLTDAGAAAQYWSEASGRWEKQAEHPKAD